MDIPYLYWDIHKEIVVALYVKDPEVDRLAERLMRLRRTSKTEAVRQALLHELERAQGNSALVEAGVALCRKLRAKGNPAKGKPADKAFIDSLYED
jgi:antitoxin VapB